MGSVQCLRTHTLPYSCKRRGQSLSTAQAVVDIPGDSSRSVGQGTLFPAPFRSGNRSDSPYWDTARCDLVLSCGPRCPQASTNTRSSEWRTSAPAMWSGRSWPLAGELGILPLPLSFLACPAGWVAAWRAGNCCWLLWLWYAKDSPDEA